MPTAEQEVAEEYLREHCPGRGAGPHVVVSATITIGVNRIARRICERCGLYDTFLQEAP